MKTIQNLILSLILLFTSTTFAQQVTEIVPTTNQVCIPAGDHSQVLLLDGNFEQKRIQPEIHWVSFPRLNRTGNNAVDATDLIQQMTPDPQIIKLYYSTGEYSNATVSNGIWNWNNTTLDQIFSTKGYKLATTYFPIPENISIDITGTRVDPETYLTVGTNGENWLGYFLPYPCHVEDAFRKCWDKIKIIKTQNWSMVRLAQGQDFISMAKDPYLYDGDMVVVEMFENATFQWDESTIPILLAPPSTLQYFSYDEEIDYVPIVVELEANDPAEEIGVFVNGECQGASVVSGNTTTINAYILDDTSNGEPIEIVKYNSTKGDTRLESHQNYYVYNPQTGTSTKSTLQKNSAWSFYYLPLEKTTTGIKSVSKSSASIFPNPTRGNIICNLTLSKPDNITIDLYNAQGQEIAHLMEGFIDTGNHKIPMNLLVSNVHSGIYYLKISGSTLSDIKKVIIY